ncbi:hypothetical protein [Nocardia callitridis]|uniref:ATP-binding protein n=1 Tax=Nocardia callitridis TaxID=648753 RepID=A0ABP9KJ60_9NOCA
MPEDKPKLYGLQSITGRLLEQLLARSEGRSRKLPVIVALGPRGSGKTALLRNAADRCERIPHVYFDFDDHDSDPKGVLGGLAFGLSKRWYQFGRIAFPQLWLCLLVVGSTLEGAPTNRRRALRELGEIMADDQPVEQNREAIVQLVRWTGSIVPGLPAWLAPAADGLLRGLGWFDRRRLLQRLPRMDGIPGTGPDMLADLAKWDSNNDADLAAVNKLFMDAFLNDLRRAYSGFNRTRRTLNCVVLLDNVHTVSGQKFLIALQAARRTARDDWDPMVVIATSRTWMPHLSDSWHRPGGHRSSDDDYRRPRGHLTNGHSWPAPRKPTDVDTDWPRGTEPECPWSPWYLLDLSQLAAQDITDLTVHRFRHANPAITAFVRGLTGGHPGGTATTLQALSALRDIDTDDQRLSVARRIFDLPFPQQATQPSEPTLTPTSMHEHWLEQVMQDFELAADRRDLVTASAASNVDLFYQQDLLDAVPSNGEELLERLRHHLWVRQRRGAVSPDLELNPWLRHILLQELADRPDSDPRNWTMTHALCRAAYQNDGQETAARYHDVAMGNLDSALEYLGRAFAIPGRFDLPAAEAWLTDLDLITSAPSRLAVDEDPIDQVHALVQRSSADEDDALAWLVASLWISNNSVGDPGRTLVRIIKNELQRVAHGHGRGSQLLYDRAERYQ